MFKGVLDREGFHVQNNTTYYIQCTYFADTLISDQNMLCSEVAMDKALLREIVQS